MKEKQATALKQDGQGCLMASCIDIYAKPVMLVKDGSKYRRSTFGGILSLFTVVLAMAMVVHFYSQQAISHPFKMESTRRRLELGGTVTRQIS